MAQKLTDIDTSAIQKLVKIKKEQDEITKFRKKAEEMKEKVDTEVYDRVVVDYELREATLEDEAVPLKEEAREQYAKLKVIFDELDEVTEKARLAKEELEFRHAVGELSKSALDDALKEPSKILADTKKDLDGAKKLRARFVAAFHSVEELESGIETYQQASEPEPEPDTAEVEMDEDSPDGTVMMPPPSAEEMAAAAGAEPEAEAEPESTPVPDAESTAPDHTMIVPTGKLVLVDDGNSTEFPLGAFNYVGRAPDNHVQILGPAVSRKHALVAASRDGFTVKDLESPNGTFVNDERVTECSLSDGDRILIGDVELVFRAE